MWKKYIVEITLSTFYSNEKDIHPKMFVKNLIKYIEYKKISEIEHMINAWYNMIKDATPEIMRFKELFLKNFFSKSI